jgi:hypothetical protein
VTSLRFLRGVPIQWDKRHEALYVSNELYYWGGAAIIYMCE